MYQNKRVLQESELKILGVAAKKNPTATRFAIHKKKLLQNGKLSYMP